MRRKRFTNFFKNTNADKQGVLIFCHSFKTSQNCSILAFEKRFTNFSFSHISQTLISSAFAKTKKAQKFANLQFMAKSKSIYELFLKDSYRQNKASTGLNTLQLSKSEYKKASIYELLEKLPIKASLKRSFAKIKLLSKLTVKAI